MAARGSGPSRRSHTKSRKGCRTCKRRHIRCDENFPQCRNCTKHHVRCDYMDSAPVADHDSDTIATASSGHVSPIATPSSEDNVKPSSYRHDSSSYSSLNLSIPTAESEQWGSDAYLIQSLLNTVDDLDAKHATHLTTWMPSLRTHLSFAKSYPFLLDALKAISASRLAWTTQDAAVRELSVKYSTTALSGLHQAVGQFNKANSDGVFAGALVLTMQSRDWLSWSSLVGGIGSIAAAVGTWESESVYAGAVRKVNIYYGDRERQHVANRPISPQQRADTLQYISLALQNLRPHFVTRPIELHWLDQFIDLVHRLQIIEAPASQEESFEHLYVLRKWTLFLPVQCFSDGPMDSHKLLLVSHLYAMAVELGPLFPGVGSEMCGDLCSWPLAETMRYIHAMTAQSDFFNGSQLSDLLQFPQTALDGLNARSGWFRNYQASARAPSAPVLRVPDMSMFVTHDGMNVGSLSPAFTPAAFQPSHTRASSQASISASSSAYLEVPTPQAYLEQMGFTNNISQWAAYPSPNFPPHDGYSEDEHILTDDEVSSHLELNFSDPFGGYIQPCEIWT